MAKNYTVCLTVLVLLFSWTSPAAAAPGDPGDGNPCAPNTYQLARPSATYPPDVDLCASSDSSWVTVINDPDDWFPCDQYIYAQDTNQRNHTLFFYPAPLENFTTSIRGRFLVWPQPQLFSPTNADNVVFKISIYDQDTGAFVTSVNEVLGSNTKIETFYSNSGSWNYYYTVYVVEWQATVPAGFVNDIYFTTRVNRTDLTLNFFYNMSNWQVSSSDGFNMLNYCPIPNTFPPLPATFTPTPPTGYTPFPTPYQTAVPGTLVPTWTATPYVFVTMLPPRPSATPIPINTWAPIQIPPLPTIAPVATGSVPITLTVQSIATTRESEYTEMFAYTTDLATRWAEPVNESIETLEITGTTGFSSTVETIDAGIEYASYPFRFLRAMAIYTPNTWPFWAVMISGFALYVLTKVIRFAVTIIVTLIEWIRRIWEAIPLN